MILKNIQILLICFGCCYGLLVPGEIKTILFYIINNIPPIRKGTDSRVGFGFRLGPNADFQILFELGPQQNTQPLAPDAGSGSKREVVAGKLYTRNDWDDTLLTQQNSIGTGPTPELNKDIVNHLRQLYKSQKDNQNENDS